MKQRGTDSLRRLLGLFSQISLTKRFALVSFSILLSGMLIIGWWVNREIEPGVMNLTAWATSSCDWGKYPCLSTADKILGHDDQKAKASSD